MLMEERNHFILYIQWKEFCEQNYYFTTFENILKLITKKPVKPDCNEEINVYGILSCFIKKCSIIKVCFYHNRWNTKTNDDNIDRYIEYVLMPMH